MSFAAANQSEQFGSGGGGVIASVTTGVGSSDARFLTFQWWGWTSVAGVFQANFAPDSVIGSSVPTLPTYGGSNLVGIYSGDSATGTSSASEYLVVLAGVVPSGAVNTLTIDGTPIGANTLTTLAMYQPSYTIFRFFLTTPGTNLFGTSGSHTVAIT